MSDKVFDSPIEYMPNAEIQSSVVPEENNSKTGSSLLENIRKENERRMKEIRPTLLLIERPLDLTDEGFRRAVFPKLSFGLRKAGELVAYLTYNYKRSVDGKKRAMAVAALDDFNDYAQKNELKGTDKLREYYISINEGVNTAQEQEAVVEAYLENAKTIKQEIVMALSVIKAMVYGMKESDFLSGQASSDN